MAKPTFAKFGLKINNETQEVEFNGQTIEVKQYLPIEEKIQLVSKIVQQSIDDNNYANPIRLELFTTLEMIYAYTNIVFTDKQKEDIFKIYDLIMSNGLDVIISECIPEEETQKIVFTASAVIDEVYKYKTSVLGILEAISTDYSNLDLNATEIQKKLADPNNMALLKDVLTKLG